MNEKVESMVDLVLKIRRLVDLVLQNDLISSFFSACLLHRPSFHDLDRGKCRCLVHAAEWLSFDFCHWDNLRGIWESIFVRKVTYAI